jgi:hypothetical protein
MRYVTALVGAVFVFVVVFILTAILIAFLPAVFRVTVQVGAFYTNNVGGVVLGALAAAGSFRATVRRGQAKGRMG